MATRPPLLVPAVQPIELFFFQRLFERLRCKQERRLRAANPDNCNEGAFASESGEAEQGEVPLVDFQRAMVRLFRVIGDDRRFNALDHDCDRTGRVGWYEFCSLWRDRGVYARLSLAERVFLTLEDADRSWLGKLWSFLIFGAIFGSTGSFILSTLPESQTPCPLEGAPNYDPGCRPRPKEVFRLIDLACIVLFTVEYFVRLSLSAFMRSELADFEKNQLLLWMVRDTAMVLPSKSTRVFQWVTHWANIIDLAAILPWYLSEAFASDAGGSQSVVLKIIRLSRVIRAFRLGRRFQAVVIIMRSVRRSIRALYVLVLNLFLGMIFFGALMYFAEQGSWDPVTKAYLRWEDTTTQSKSPFESIPACFWWAIVTATTVGYGDDHTPTTLAGRVIAGISMIWSLCVLALPIGVIGGNFNQVWEDYQRIKQQEKEDMLKEELMLKKSVAWGDPLYQCRQLIVEVWHDSGLASLPADMSQSEFIGEVCFTLEITPHEPIVKRRVQQPLAENLEKARRKVSGSLTFEYSWQPLVGKSESDILVLGCLEITVVGAENIVRVDWNGSGITDPFCTVTAYPNSPDKDGNTAQVVKRTSTVYDTITPTWEETVSFDMCWTKSASRRGLVADMKRTAGLSTQTTTISQSPPRKSPSTEIVNSMSEQPVSHLEPDCERMDGFDWCYKTRSNAVDDEVASLLGTLPGLQEEVGELRAALPQLRAEVASVRRDLQLALAALEKQAMPPCAAGQPAVREGAVRGKTG